MRFLIHFIIYCSTICKAEKPEQTIDSSYANTYPWTRPLRKPVNRQPRPAPSSTFYARSSALVRTHDKVRRTAKGRPGRGKLPCQIPRSYSRDRRPISLPRIRNPKLPRLLRQNMQRARNRPSTPQSSLTTKSPNVCSMLQNRTLRRRSVSAFRER